MKIGDNFRYVTNQCPIQAAFEINFGRYSSYCEVAEVYDDNDAIKLRTIYSKLIRTVYENNL